MTDGTLSGARIYDHRVDARDAADRWARTWERAWTEKDVEAIAALYAADVEYRAHPLREPHAGGARGYVLWAFADEEGVRCRFGAPIVSGDRAAVEWWATLREAGSEVTLVGVSVLRFGADGLVVEQRDHWHQGEGRQDPYPGWHRDHP